MGDEEDNTEFNAACAWFEDLKGDFKPVRRMKNDLYIENGVKFENMKRNSSG
jgi:hypothetical protein